MTNPLLEDWQTDFALPPFDRLSDEDFAPAFEAAMAEGRAAHDAIARNPEAPSFANTIEAMELADEALDKVAAVFFNLAGTDSNPAREALQRDLSPKLSAYASEITSNAALFQRVQTLWEGRAALDLSPEQARVLELYHRMFLRAGAALQGEAAARMTAIKSRLASLGTQFAQNVLAEEREWVMPLAEDELEGLPDFLRAAAADAARERDMPGHVISLNRSLIVPFLEHSPRRELRQRAYQAWTSRGENGGETDNRALIREILELRAERAALLGHDSFAAWKLEPEMARTSQAVRDLLMAVWAPAKTAAEADAAVLEAMLHADGHTGPLEPWDWRYYADKRRRAEHDLEDAAIKPYLGLEAMIAAAFDCAHRLFGLEFRPLDVPLHHKDARAWEVTRDGRHMGVFIGDYFARPSKRSGAWCSAFRSQRKLGGDRRAVAVNVCNFAKGDPALLSWDDARTLFHEFGHALHHLLSDVTHGFVSGTSVARDFVELPSQLYEHWLEVPEVLRQHARHVVSGAPMPAEMLERLLAAQNFDQGFATVEYVASALVDLELHDGPAPADPMQRQAEVLAALGLPRAIRMRHASPHFLHVFAGDGYSSGYYSYMWSEVMDADAFAAFGEAGDPFDPAVARRLEACVLAAGGSEEPEELYTRFRGRMPGVDALLRGRGLAA
ncbi:M3 family metallopeptidase [Rhodobacteraceae bacterium 2376]|uniref:M3 family metallopeptidase n=1 Tax=Rhabdonatronobacter sediminivivens TaxID=2743469 RepID=A0A7Z0HY31_9RHOB|nr:M3 family metallopeptidase [Rhabdonatronobacter sediminivivens]NYS24403.1 M3 family metallopeptidase [Rhabdonatronobacter sediminivivens]